jgi:hypothetical protein
LPKGVFVEAPQSAKQERRTRILVELGVCRRKGRKAFSCNRALMTSKSQFEFPWERQKVDKTGIKQFFRGYVGCDLGYRMMPGHHGDPEI